MTSVRIYTKQGCGHSARARDLLEDRGIPYEEVDVTGRPDLRAEMVEAAAGHDTTPQIFIGGEHIGGADDLEELDESGRLAALLTADGAQPSA